MLECEIEHPFGRELSSTYVSCPQIYVTTGTTRFLRWLCCFPQSL